MNKIQRQLIHKTLISFLISVPFIVSAQTLWDIKTEKFPDREMVVVADGKIQRKYHTVNGHAYVIVNNKPVRVKENVMTDYKVGQRVVLEELGPRPPMSEFRIFILFLCSFALFVGAIFGIFASVIKYFEWVNGE